MEKLIYFFPLFFIGMWTLATFIVSKMGWSNLANKYKLEQHKKFERIGFTSASINKANYSNALILYKNKEGLSIKTALPFRLFHPQIFIPWSEIKEVKSKDVLFFKFKELTIGEPIIAKIKIQEKTFKKLGYQLSKNK